jgi:4-alpha-glucanotransferase
MDADMLVCGEDLGMIPRCVQGVLDEFNLLGLRVQRSAPPGLLSCPLCADVCACSMPKDQSIPFDHPETYPWLSVATPSVHDCSTMRHASAIPHALLC